MDRVERERRIVREIILVDRERQCERLFSWSLPVIEDFGSTFKLLNFVLFSPG